MVTSIVVLGALMAVADGGAPGPPVAPRPPLLAPPPASSSAASPASDYRLERAKDGSGDLLYDATAFAARIARDGSVRFSDKHVISLDLIPFLPLAPPAGVPTLQGTLRSLLRKGPRTPPPAVDPIPTPLDPRLPSDAITRYRPDAREACQYPRSCFFDAAVVLVGITVRLDITDTIMRLHGQDPYRYEKARFLSATRDLRARMAARAHAEDLQHSAADLPARLQQIACDGGLSLVEKRAVLEALRTELDSEIDAAPSDRLIRATLQTLGHPDAGLACPVGQPSGPAVRKNR